MLTPAFELSQDERFLTIKIKTPLVKPSEAETFIDEKEFTFYCKPYYLRLTLPGSILEDGRESGKYDFDTSLFTFIIPKACPGECFEGLDLLTQLLAPTGKSSAAAPCIEVLSTENDEENNHDDGEEDEIEDFDWQIEQFPFSENESPTSGPMYGFANRQSGVLKRLQEALQDVVDLPDPDSTKACERRTLREADENKLFDDDHYLYDCFQNSCVEDILAYKSPWLDLYKKVKSGMNADKAVVFDDDEKAQMRNLPRKEYLLDKGMTQQVLLNLVDILFAYAYNHRTTEGENTVESGWTIQKLSGTLSWLENYSTPKDVALASYRRSLCFPLYRHWSLSEKVFKDVLRILYVGQRLILKCLLEIRTIFFASEPRYILNELYINDYCVWIQSVKKKQLYSLAKNMADVKITKADIGYELDLIEQAALLALEEESGDNKSDSANLECALTGLCISES